MEHIAELAGEGEVETITRIRRRRKCVVCGEYADYRITYLLDNCRRNPASKAYQHDDCSWCADAEEFACVAHEDKVKRHPPEGMGWCSTFPADKFPQMLLFWEPVR
jgi:hypothetical protein